MKSRCLLLLLLISVLFVHIRCDDKGGRKPLSKKAKEFLKDGMLDKLSDQERKNLRPKDLANITRDKLKDAGRDLLKNLTEIVKKGGKKDVEKLAAKLNCTQIRYMLNDTTSKWNCAVLKGLVPAVERCKKASAMKMKDMKLEPLAKCGLLKNLSKDDFKELAKKGAFKDAPRDAKKEYGKKAKDVYGEPERWSKEDLDDMKDFIDEVPSKYLKKVPKEVVADSLKKGGGKKFDNQKKSDIFRHLFKGKKNLTMENITWACEAGFGSQLRPKDIKDLPKEKLKMHAKCFGRAHSSVRKEFTKRVCSMPMMFDNRTAKACVYFLADIKPSVLKNNTRVVQHLLNAYLNISEKKRPALKGEVCRILARAFMKKKMKYPHLKPGPLVTCMNRTAKEIVDDPDSLKEIAKKKGSKALKREIVKELLKNKAKNGKALLKFVDELNIEEIKNFNFTKELGLDDDDDDDETLEDDESKGACNDDDDDDDDDVDDDSDDDSDDDDDDSDDDDSDDDSSEEDEEEVPFCNPGKRFIVARGIGRISDLTVPKIVKIARKLIHGGFTEQDIYDLDNDEFDTIVAILSKRENVFSMRQAAKIVQKYKKLYMNSSDALDDMEGMIAFLNNTDVDSIPREKCDEIIKKLRESGFLGRMAMKVQMEHVKTILSKCVRKKIENMTGDELVNLGHLVALLDPSEFDKIPESLFKENLEEFRDNLEEQMRQKGFGRLIKNITMKIIDALGKREDLTEDDMASLGVLRKGLDKDDVKGMKREVLENLKDYSDDLDVEAAKQLFKSLYEGGGSRRKRAITDYSSQDADFFLNLGQAILALPADEIANIQDTVFEDIVGTVSQTSGWSSEQLTKWAEKAKSVWGDANTFTSDELLLLNNFAKGFSSTELNSMDFSSNDVIESFGQVSGFTPEQAQKIFEKVKSSSAVNTMSGADLLRLGRIALGMSVQDIGMITTEAFKAAFTQFGGMTGWSEEQLVALKNEAVDAYGETKDWDGGLLSTANVIIGGFTNDEVKGLKSDDLQFISTEAIEALSPAKFSQLSAELLGELDTEQAQSVTEQQIAELSEEQKNALSGAESGGDGNGDGDGDGNNTVTSTIKPDSGSMQSVFGAISLLLPLLCSQLVL